MSSFSLAKWYMDCVTTEGDVFLAYQAKLRWRAVHLDYASVLDRGTTLGRCPALNINGERLVWHAARLGVTGTWTGGAEAVGEQIDEGVEWKCVRPCAQTLVRAGSEVVQGLGYAELLTLTVPPWALGIDELRWGRFLSASGWLVWIHIRGANPRNITICNGDRVGPDTVDGLDLSETKVLRDGALGDTVLSAIPAVNKLFPRSVLRMRETKWRSRGVLRMAGRPPTEGWAIHEVVTWT